MTHRTTGIFPDVYLDAVNREAARLMATKKPDAEPVRALVVDLSAKLAELDKALSAIKRQLTDRGNDDPKWKRAAMHARAKYRQQYNSILSLLKTARTTLQMIDSQTARATATERAERNLGAQAEARRKREEERLARIAAARNENEAFSRAFKKVCKQELGEPLYLSLVEKANALAETMTTERARVS